VIPTSRKLASLLPLLLLAACSEAPEERASHDDQPVGIGQPVQDGTVSPNPGPTPAPTRMQSLEALVAASSGAPYDPASLRREGFVFPQPAVLPPDAEGGLPRSIDASVEPYTFTHADVGPPLGDHSFRVGEKVHTYRRMSPPGVYSDMALPSWPQFVPTHGQLPPTRRILRYSTTVNARGLRGERVYAAQAPEGTFRIGVIGTGVTFGEGVEDAEVYPVYLEELLNRKPPGEARYEVINFGVSSVTMDLASGLLLRYEAEYDPDLWIVAFGVNDALPMFERPIGTFERDLDQLLGVLGAAGKPALFLVEPANTFYPWMAEYEAYMGVFHDQTQGRIEVLDAAGILDCHELADGLRLEQHGQEQRVVRYRAGEPQVVYRTIFEPTAGAPTIAHEVYTYLDGHEVYLRTFVTDVHMNPWGHYVLAQALAEWVGAHAQGEPAPSFEGRVCGWF
jgi:hypothetical protein